MLSPSLWPMSGRNSALTVTIILLVLGLAIYSEELRYFLVGITGAIFANSTGAGGGVVFIPLFSQLGFTEAESLSTSFGIQCFGMTAGAIAWCRYYQNKARNQNTNWQSFIQISLLAAIFSVAGIWSNYLLELQPLSSLQLSFRVFSGALGVCILASVYLSGDGISRGQLARFDYLAIITIAFIGGIMTGWLSVAVGEMLAFYLIFRRYDVMMSVASAVVVTAITVWSVSPIHFAADSSINWGVLIYAGPGAVVGGITARYLATLMPPKRLKLFFAVWLLLISIMG